MPQTYLRDVLLPASIESDVHKLAPHGWKEHFAAQVAAQRDALLAKVADAS